MLTIFIAYYSNYERRNAAAPAAATESVVPSVPDSMAPPAPEAQLPPGWVAAIDPGSGRTYYANTVTVSAAPLIFWSFKVSRGQISEHALVATPDRKSAVSSRPGDPAWFAC